jgi:hypothetical protein
LNKSAPLKTVGVHFVALKIKALNVVKDYPTTHDSLDSFRLFTSKAQQIYNNTAKKQH